MKRRRDPVVDFLVDNPHLLPTIKPTKNCVEFETEKIKIVLETDYRKASLKLVDKIRKWVESGRLGKKGEFQRDIFYSDF